MPVVASTQLCGNPSLQGILINLGRNDFKLPAQHNVFQKTQKPVTRDSLVRIHGNGI